MVLVLVLVLILILILILILVLVLVLGMAVLPHGCATLLQARSRARRRTENGERAGQSCVARAFARRGLGSVAPDINEVGTGGRTKYNRIQQPKWEHISAVYNLKAQPITPTRTQDDTYPSYAHSTTTG